MNTTAKSPDLSVVSDAVDFYDERYRDGYMDEWPVRRHELIANMLKGLDLPEFGRALDFGCGNGLLTEVLRSELPGWEVTGTDLSGVAVNNAKALFPQCHFFEGSESADHLGEFDFVFSNHVFEHVYDLAGTFGEMAAFLSPTGSMLHIMPCGNPGSFEEQICQLRTDGIDPKHGNRWFSEEPGHLRRLTSDQFIALGDEIGFEHARSYFTNQRKGAIEWITAGGPGTVMTLTSTSTAVDAAARRKLLATRIGLLGVLATRLPNTVVWKLRQRPTRGWKWYAMMAAATPAHRVSAMAEKRIQRAVREEWAERSDDPAGSEMGIFLVRNQASDAGEL